MPVPTARGHRAALSHLPGLDGLRALAVGLVILTHAAFMTGFVSSGGMLGRIWGRGDFGVAIFFALSGFLLYRSLAAEEEQGGMRLGDYWWRRAVRILPAYWLALGVVSIAAHPPLRTVVLHATATQVYSADLGIRGFGQSWSIATELAFYAVLPLLVLALRNPRRRNPQQPMRLLIILALIGIPVAGIMGGGIIGSEPLYERWLPARLTNFVLGMILAEALARPKHRLSLWICSLAASPTTCLGLAGAAYLLATTPIAGSLTLGGDGGDLSLAVKLVLSCVVAFGLLVPLLWGPPSLYRRTLTHPASGWLGRVSYGIFLWHLPIFEGLYAISGLRAFTGGMVPLLALGVPLTLAAAALSYHLLEDPTTRLVARRLRQRREEREGESPPPRAHPPGQHSVQQPPPGRR